MKRRSEKISKKKKFCDDDANFFWIFAPHAEQPHNKDNAERHLRQGDSDDDDDDFFSAREKFTPSSSVLPRLLLLFVVGPCSRRIWIWEKSDGRDDFFVFFISPNNNNNNTSTSISDDRHE